MRTFKEKLYFSNVLANFFISLLAALFVTAFVITGGAMFQSLAQSILMLSLAALEFTKLQPFVLFLNIFGKITFEDYQQKRKAQTP